MDHEHQHAEQGEQHGHQGHHAKMVADFRRRFWVSLILSIPVLVLAPMIQGLLGLRQTLAFPGAGYLQWALASVIFFYGGWPFLAGMVREIRQRNPGMMTLIALAVAVAYVYSSFVAFGIQGKVFFWELATLIDVMLVGHWIEMRSVMGASGALEELVKLMPAQAHRLAEDGSTEEVLVSELTGDDRVRVKPGEKIPTDGVIVEGRSTLNESMLTGESKPVERGEGEQVIGGAINGDSALTVEVTRTGDETYLARVVEMVRRAQESRSRTQDLATRAARWLTAIALGVGGGTLALWLVLGRPFEYALERMVTVMVITCPHALGLAVPLVVAVSTALAAGRGLLIRDRAAFERARLLDAVVFDKTGTLTRGSFEVREVVALGEASEEEILGLAAGVEASSEHSIARGIVEHARRREIAVPQAGDFTAIPGKGARAEVDGRVIEVVSPGYLAEQEIELESDQAARLAEEGKTVVYVLADGAPLGAVALGDVVRPESREAIARLKEAGVQVMMLTGDAEAVARSVAAELELDDYFAEVLPEDKADRIRQVRERGLRVAMVGDGVNDAPALAEADLGVAIGAGTDVAVETADVVLVRSDPRDVSAIITLAAKTHAKMVQNLWWATAYNAIAIPLAAGVLAPVGFLLPPAAGAVVMSVSTVVVAVNARLLGRAERELERDDPRPREATATT